jgi:hypothetical protein
MEFDQRPQSWLSFVSGLTNLVDAAGTSAKYPQMEL